MSRIEQLPEVTEQVLSGLQAGDELKNRIYRKALEPDSVPARRSRLSTKLSASIPPGFRFRMKRKKQPLKQAKPMRLKKMMKRRILPNPPLPFLKTKAQTDNRSVIPTFLPDTFQAFSLRAVTHCQWI